MLVVNFALSVFPYKNQFQSQKHNSDQDSKVQEPKKIILAEPSIEVRGLRRRVPVAQNTLPDMKHFIGRSM